MLIYIRPNSQEIDSSDLEGKNFGIPIFVTLWQKLAAQMTCCDHSLSGHKVDIIE